MTPRLILDRLRYFSGLTARPACYTCNVTNRSTTRGRPIGARAAAWLAAYALVLQTVLAPIAAAAATNAAAADTAQLVLCSEHAGALDRSQPVAPHDHEQLCKFCIGYTASVLLAPDTFAAARADFAISPIRWHVVLHLVRDRGLLGDKQARGPPTLT